MLNDKPEDEVFRVIRRRGSIGAQEIAKILSRQRESVEASLKVLRQEGVVRSKKKRGQEIWDPVLSVPRQRAS